MKFYLFWNLLFWKEKIMESLKFSKHCILKNVTTARCYFFLPLNFLIEEIIMKNIFSTKILIFNTNFIKFISKMLKYFQISKIIVFCKIFWKFPQQFEWFQNWDSVPFPIYDKNCPKIFPKKHKYFSKFPRISLKQVFEISHSQITVN